jgi:phosphatidylserine synthase
LGNFNLLIVGLRATSVKISILGIYSLGDFPMSSKQKYWFPAKRYGWGWGFPSCWQGWVVTSVYFVLLGVGILSFSQNTVVFASFAAILTLLLLVICWIKGEPPRWRWGKD